MKRKRLMKTFIIIGAILFIWLVLAQSCMKFRISDSEAKQKFALSNVQLFTETIEVDGFSMHYAKTGNDTFPTLFFVHGSPGSWDAFSVYLRDKNLLSKYRMVSVDRPGFGYSEFGNAKNLDEQSKLISPLLKMLSNKKPIYVVGHSLGGPMAVKLDADNPGIFSGMVLLAASVDPAAENPEKWRPVLYKTPLKYFLPGAFRPSNEELWYLKKDLKYLADDFSKVTCPVWIIHGDKDKFVPVSNADYAKKMLVNAKSVEIKILKDAPHFIPWEPWYKDVKEVLMRLHN
jgi:pimeloyl-ACP methyl ester carboxylesterase